MNIVEPQERVLERLVGEFGDDFINFTKTNRIGLYGADESVLELFRDKLLFYLKEKGRKTKIKFGRNGVYNIDVGFFLKIGYFKGFNEEK